MSRRHIAAAILALALLSLAACSPPATPITPLEDTPVAGSKDELVLAGGTTVYDSGLLDTILPDFTAKTGITVRVAPMGTTQALAQGAAGDADVLLTHDPESEQQFVAEGKAKGRFEVMYNDFVVVGPPGDPAGVRSAANAADAFARIADAQAPFISRGDESGTHLREQAIWKQAGVVPQGAWYRSTGQGMGEALSTASQAQAYTLVDRATYLVRKQQGLALELLFAGDPALRNQYSVLPVTPDKEHDINYGAAVAFINWITSAETQKAIGEFGVHEYGQPLYTPNAR